MINYKCYKADELIKLLGNNFHIIDEKVQDNFSDWCTGDVDTENVNKFYITNRYDIKEIIEWHGLWTVMVIKLIDNTEIKLHSSNINSQDKSLIRIVENELFSPSFKRQENYILANDNLDKWLSYNGITQKQLEAISVDFSLYPTYIYKDIYDPIIKNGEICGYHCQDMRLSEDKIDKALADIKDIETRLKIDKILKSFEKVFQ